MDYKFYTEPLSHQRRVFDETAELPSYAIFWEQGTGKTKLMIDTAASLWQAGKINAVLILAPSGVERNWFTDELPAHCPPAVESESYQLFFQTSKAANLSFKRLAWQAIHHPGLTWVAMSYDAFRTAAGKKFAWELLKKRRVFYVLDESEMIKTPGAKRTITVVASGRYAAYRRILTGTPVSQGPFDVYSQMKFLDENFWKRHELNSASEFRQHFGIYKPIAAEDSASGAAFDLLIGYRRLDQLRQILAPHRSRVLKADVLDLPPKLYTTRYFEMTPAQKRVYRDIKQESMTFLDSGEMVTAALAITRDLRLHQITSNYLPTPEGEEEPITMIGPENPRLNLLVEICSRVSRKALIFARFIKDIDLIMEQLGPAAVRYDGTVDVDQRLANKNRFVDDPAVRFFVATAAAAGRGLTLTVADTVIYYSNNYKLTERLQSEDRAHRMGQKNAVTYVDLIAPDTVDVRIVSALRRKMDVASQVTGDEPREWMTL